MKKQCFTCKNKLSRYLNDDEVKEIKKKLKEDGVKYPRVSDIEFKCKLTNKIISQIDPACDEYEADDVMVDIRVQLAKTARKLRRELNNDK